MKLIDSTSASPQRLMYECARALKRSAKFCLLQKRSIWTAIDLFSFDGVQWSCDPERMNIYRKIRSASTIFLHALFMLLFKVSLPQYINIPPPEITSDRLITFITRDAREHTFRTHFPAMRPAFWRLRKSSAELLAALNGVKLSIGSI